LVLYAPFDYKFIGYFILIFVGKRDSTVVSSSGGDGGGGNGSGMDGGQVSISASASASAS